MPYLNSEVFYRHLPDDRFGPTGDFELVSLPPRQMAQAVEHGVLDAGPLPVAEIFRLEHLLLPLGDLCIATRDEAESVLLLSRRAATELDGATIAVTSQTATSVQLLRVLLADLWHVSPRCFVRRGESADAVLLIGDDALRARKGIDGYPFVCDLGKEWRTLSGLPMVFALWVIRREVESRATRLSEVLEASLDRSLGELALIARERRDVDMTESEIADYLRYFIYRMGHEEQQSVTAFREAVERLPVWRPDSGAGAKVC